MDCQDLRRYLLSEPWGNDSSAKEHLVQCEPCRRVSANLAQLERSIEAAALSVEAPEGLTSRVLLSDHKPRARSDATQ
jgi:predicted anti-sigma-YlaC factor YlaD